jgi:hypothetical protein
MDEDSDFRFESFSRADGGASYALVHIPTGLRVEDTGPSSKPIVERWAALRLNLAELLRAAAE